MQRIFIRFFLTAVLLSSLLGLGFDWWSHSESFANFSQTAIESAAKESGTEIDLEQGRADLQTAGLLVFVTIAALAWLPILLICLLNYRRRDTAAPAPSLFSRPIVILTGIGLALWLRNLAALWI